MKICIIGSGYVGLVTGTCLSDFGLEVICVDKDENKIEILNSDGIPIYEPNLENLIKKNIKEGRLTFTTDIKSAVRQSKVIAIAVGTPPKDDGSSDLEQIKEVTQQIAQHMNDYKVIVIKSTVPIGTARKIKEIINKHRPKSVIPTPSSAMDKARKILHDITYCQDEYETAQGSDVLVIATEWNQFRNLDLIKIKGLLNAPILIDLRNLYEPKRVKELGFIYKGVGRW